MGCTWGIYCGSFWQVYDIVNGLHHYLLTIAAYLYDFFFFFFFLE